MTFYNDVKKDLDELRKLKVRGAAKALKNLGQIAASELESQYGDMTVRDCADLLIALA